MKTTKLPVTSGFVFIALALLILGFSGPPADETAGSDDNGVVRFKLDGADWISGPPGHPELAYEEEAITDGRTLVRIEAFAADGSHLALNIYRPSGIGPGVYPITGTGMSGFYKIDFERGDDYVTNGMRDNPGAITITELTADKVVGNFEFALRNAADPDDIWQITGGSFDVRFSQY